MLSLQSLRLSLAGGSAGGSAGGGAGSLLSINEDAVVTYDAILNTVTITGSGTPYDGTYTQDVDGRSLTAANLASGPMFLVAPVLTGDSDPQPGETLTVTPGLVVYDPENGTPTVSYTTNATNSVDDTNPATPTLLLDADDLWEGVLSHNATSQSVNFSRLDTSDGSPILVEWADGSTTTIASGTGSTKTYSAALSGVVRIRATGVGARITRLEQTIGGWNYSFADLPSGLTYLYLNGAGFSVTGTLADLPSGLTYLLLFGNGFSVTSTLADLPSGLEILYLFGNGFNVTGTLADLPSGLEILYLNGAGFNVTSTLADLPSGLTYLYLFGAGFNVTGTLADLPSGLTYLLLGGAGFSVTGTLADLPSGLTSLYLLGAGFSVTGTLPDLPSGLTFLYLNVAGFIVTGTLADLPSGLTFLSLLGAGSNVTGTPADLPSGLTYLYLGGAGFSVTGTLADLPSGLTYLSLLGAGFATLAPAVFTPAQASMRHVRISSAMSSTTVDNILISYANVLTWTNERLVRLNEGGAAARTSASDTAVTTLQSRSVTVITN